VATARAGNVIGGGDWSADRLLPDAVRAWSAGTSLQIRRPEAVRPWQHVLEPVSGYLRLAEQLLSKEGARFAGPWNFGPNASGDAPVGEVADLTARLFGDGARTERAPSPGNPHEAGYLRLDNRKAKRKLGWKPRWSLKDALERTVEWHRAWRAGTDVRALSLEQIRDYEASR
jgi:CDP-glucose 4,6-dehydratase